MGAARLDVASQLGFDALPVLLSRIALPGIACITRYSASVPCLVLPGVAKPCLVQLGTLPVLLAYIAWYCKTLPGITRYNYTVLSELGFDPPLPVLLGLIAWYGIVKPCLVQQFSELGFDPSLPVVETKHDVISSTAII